jgi:uncharacterized glyoxalase superfamily protein PhnB
MPEQRIVPMLAYEDAGAAIDWLREAFGFEEVADQRHTDGDGTVTHAELRVGESAIFLATPNKDYESPRRHRETCDAAGRWLDNPWVIDGVYVGVDDLDQHFEQARAAGATILRSPEDPGIGQRIYSAEDLEGHRWMFGETG